MTESRKRANEKYNAKAYDQIKVIVKKGQRDIIKSFAESKGMSLNGYINKLITEDMEQNGYSLNAHQSDDSQSSDN